MDRIDGGGPRGFECFAYCFNVPQECRPRPSPKGARALSKAIGRRSANRAGAAHNHFFDGPRGLAEVAGWNDLKFVGQESLLDKQDFVAPDVKRHGAKMAGVTADGYVQAISTFIFWIVVWMPR